MTAPALVGTTTLSQSSGVTDTTFSPTFGTHAAGDMLEVDVGADGNIGISITGGSGGWAKDWEVQHSSGTPTHAKFHKLAASASESLGLTGTAGEAWAAAVRVYRGSGGTLNYYSAAGKPDSGADKQGDAIAPGVGSQEFTFTQCMVMDGVQGTNAAPSGYGNYQTNNNVVSSRVDISTAEKAATASSDTPAAWDNNVETMVIAGGAVWETAGSSGPTITDQPDNATAVDGETAVFAVAATGAGTLSYQWQVDTGGGFANVSTGSGGTTDEYTTGTLSLSDSGNEYRCVVTDDDGSVNSSAAILSVNDGTYQYRDIQVGGTSTLEGSTELAAPTMIAGDLDIIIIGAGTFAPDAGPTMGTPSGYTLLAGPSEDFPLAEGALNTVMYVFGRIADGAGSPVTFTASDPSLWGWTRVSYDNPNALYFGQAILDYVGLTSSAVLPSLTTTKTNAMVLTFISQGIVQEATPPGGSEVVRYNDDESDDGVLVADEQFPTIGATGTRTYGFPTAADAVFALVELHSLVSESAGGTDDTADGVTVSSAASLIPGSAEGVRSPTQDGVISAAAASLITGSAAGETNATADGALTSAAASLIPGAADGVQSPTADGQTLTAAASIIPGAADGVQSPTADGAVLTAAASLIPGTASAGVSPTADGVTLSATAALIPGAATGEINVTADGVTLSADANLIAGDATGVQSPTADGVTLSAAASLIPGTADAGTSPTADGVLLSAAASLIPGAATGVINGTAEGVVLTVAASLIPGTAEGQVNGVADGQTMTAAASMIAGDAFAGTAGDATGVLLTAAASVVPGTTDTTRAPTVDGVTLPAAASLVPGAASAVRSPTASGDTMAAAASFIAGLAGGGADVFAPGATVTAAASLIDGAADGETNIIAPGVILTAAASMIPGATEAVRNATAAAAFMQAIASLIRGTAIALTNDPSSLVAFVESDTYEAYVPEGQYGVLVPESTSDGTVMGADNGYTANV